MALCRAADPVVNCIAAPGLGCVAGIVDIGGNHPLCTFVLVEKALAISVFSNVFVQ
jgi:hypothetical protein